MRKGNGGAPAVFFLFPVVLLALLGNGGLFDVVSLPESACAGEERAGMPADDTPVDNRGGRVVPEAHA